MFSKSSLELTKISHFGETEAGSKAIWDVSQDLKAEIPSLSQPGCCLCRELWYPQRRVAVLGVSAGSVLPQGNAAVGDSQGKTKISRPYMSLPLSTGSHGASSAHTARGGHLEGTWSLSVPPTGGILHDRGTPSLGSERDEQIEAFPLFSFLPSPKIT